MTYITKKVEEAGSIAEEITVTAVDAMFALVAEELAENTPNAMLKKVDNFRTRTETTIEIGKW